jgi:hypothetical protein
MEKLLSKSDKILGCELNIPETIVFDNGKPKLYLKTEKDGCVT